MKNLITIEQLNKEEILEILSLAKEIEENPNNFLDKLRGKSLATLFFQPSTRTRISSSLAMQKLGGNVVDLYESKFEKGMSESESLEDTIKVMGDYVDLICLRYSLEDAPFIAEKNTNAKIINCGNGKDQHPTQALLDLYAIWKEFGRLDNLNIAIVGDLKNSRSAHSLLIALSFFEDNNVTLISPSYLKMPEKYFSLLKNKLRVIETEDFEIKNGDIIYMGGFSRLEAESRIISKFDLTLDKTKNLKERAIILSPLPRITEVSKDIDNLPQARYFEQSKNGLFVRMAILLKIFTLSPPPI